MVAMAERAGRFVVQDHGKPSEFRAFVPRPLPPHPPLVLTDEFHEWDRRAYAGLGRLSGITRVLPNLHLFLYMHVRKEAVLSSQIEGTQSSLSDLLLYEHEGAPAVPIDDVEEVSCYVAAAVRAVSLLKTLPLSMRLLKEVHGALLNGARGGDKTPGEIRTSQNWIGGTKPGDALFVPPPVRELADALSHLEKFLHDEPTRTPTLIKAALAHAQFETIHPFLDGNGRLGRLLITLVLMNERLIDTPVFYPSLFLKQNRTEYYERLQRVRTHGEWEAWLLFFVRGVALVSEAACLTVEATLALFERDRAKVMSGRGRNLANVLRVYDYAREKAVVAVPETQRALSISQPTVNSAINALQELGILREMTGKLRDRRYVYAEYVNLMSDERPLR
jgi:Fic family protein